MSEVRGMGTVIEPLGEKGVVEADRLKEVYSQREMSWRGPPKENGSPFYEQGGKQMFDEALTKLFPDEEARAEISGFVGKIKGFSRHLFEQALERYPDIKLTYHNIGTKGDWGGHIDPMAANLMVLMVGVSEDKEADLLSDFFEGGFSLHWEKKTEEEKIDFTKEILATAFLHEVDDWWFRKEEMEGVMEQIDVFLGERGVSSASFKSLEKEKDGLGLIAFGNTLGQVIEAGGVKKGEEELVVMAWFLRAADFLQVYDAAYLQEQRMKIGEEELSLPIGLLNLYGETEQVRPKGLFYHWAMGLSEADGGKRVVGPWSVSVGQSFFEKVAQEVDEKSWRALATYYQGGKNPFEEGKRRFGQWVERGKNKDRMRLVYGKSAQTFGELGGSKPEIGFYVFGD
jgi:hypothetical protein